MLHALLQAPQLQACVCVLPGAQGAYEVGADGLVGADVRGQKAARSVRQGNDDEHA